MTFKGIMRQSRIRLLNPDDSSSSDTATEVRQRPARAVDGRWTPDLLW